MNSGIRVMKNAVSGLRPARPKVTNRDYREEAQDLVGDRVLFDVPMRRLTSLRVGGPAECLIFPKDVGELRKVISHAKKRKIPFFILGRGTNLIVRDGGIRGWVISLTRGMKKIETDGDVVEAEAGAALQSVVHFSARRGLSGLEALSGIPGTVGGAVAMNAGAWGVEIKDILLSATFLDGSGKIVQRPRSKMKFAYRKLEIPSSWIVLSGRFQLKQETREEVLDRIRSYSEMRRKTQPLDAPSAGSIFKNPKEGPAGKWIEKIGLKGFRIGQAAVSDLHANFIVNLGRATAGDVLRLIEWVEKKVYEETAISLEREVKVVGE